MNLADVTDCWLPVSLTVYELELIPPVYYYNELGFYFQMRSFFSSRNFVDSLLNALLLSLIVSGILGISLHSSRLYTSQLHAGEAPPALDVFLAALTTFFSFEAFWWSTRASRKTGALDKTLSHALLQLPQGTNARRCRLGCTALSAITSPLLFILYLIGFRADGAMWVCATAIAISLITRYVWIEESSSSPASLIISETSEQEGPSSPLVDSLVGTSSSSSSSSSLTNLPSSYSPSPSLLPKQRCLDCCLPQGTPLVVRALSCFHSSLWCLASTVLVLLLGGAGTIADGWRRFPPRGRIYSISLPEFSNSPAGDTQRIHAWCSGPTNKLPTLFLDFGGGGE